MLRDFFTAPLLQFLVASLVAFVTIYVIGDYDVLAYVVAALVSGTALVAAYTWFKTFVTAARDGGRKGEAILALSMFGMCVFAISQRGWAVGRIALDDPAWMINNPIGLLPALVLWWVLVGILFAPTRVSAAMALKRPIYWVALAFISGLALGALLVSAAGRSEKAAELTPTGMLLQTAPAVTCRGPKPVFVNAYCRASPTRTIVPAVSGSQL